MTCMRRGLSGQVGAGGVELPAGIAPPQDTVTAAKTVLAGYADGSVCTVYGRSSGKAVCQLKRRSSGVYICRYIDFRNADATTFTIGLAPTDDIQVGAGMSLSFDATEGMIITGGSDGLARLLFAGLFSAEKMSIQAATRQTVSSAGDGTAMWVGFMRPDTRVGLAGALARSAGSWFLRGATGDLGTPALSGGAAFAAFPTAGETFAKHWGRDSSTQSYVIAGYDGSTEREATALISGAQVTNWDTAASHIAVIGVARVGVGNNFSVGIGEFTIAGFGA